MIITDVSYYDSAKNILSKYSESSKKISKSSKSFEIKKTQKAWDLKKVQKALKFKKA